MITIQTIRLDRFPCGFCSSGHHRYCPGNVTNGNETEAIVCPCTGCEVRPRCVNCSIREGVNPATLSCEDLDACKARIEKSKQEAYERLYKGKTRPEAPGRPASSRKTPRRAASTRAGQCLCCGEATKGGLFLPGHDSKYLNARLADISGVTSPGDVEDRMRADGCSDALIAKFHKRTTPN